MVPCGSMSHHARGAEQQWGRALCLLGLKVPLPIYHPHWKVLCLLEAVTIPLPVPVSSVLLFDISLETVRFHSLNLFSF